LIQLLFIIA